MAWIVTGSMLEPRWGHTATLLNDGKVLVAGGYSRPGAGNNQTGSSALATAEIYNPASGTWTATGSMHGIRSGHTATLLPNGQVLVTGNYWLNQRQTSAEIYDPGSGRWTETAPMRNGRWNLTATLLRTGKVLVVGGLISLPDNYVEIYDPAAGTWTTSAGHMVWPRGRHTATLLRDGRVLVAGGEWISGGLVAEAELYDPATDSWTRTGAMRRPRVAHTATFTISERSGDQGSVYVTGGETLDAVRLSGEGGIEATTGSMTSIEIYDVRIGTWFDRDLLKPRTYHTATLLADGSLLIAGGTPGNHLDPRNPSLSELWAGIARPTSSNMNAVRYGHTATLLNDGRVLVTGGTNGGPQVIGSTELYLPEIGALDPPS